MKRCGFTLAETLITLAIIGIVAALVLPTLYSNYLKQQYVTQIKEVYSQLSQALQQLKTDEGVSKISDTDTLTTDDIEDISTVGQRVGDFLKKYFKVIRDCGMENDNSCWPRR